MKTRKRENGGKAERRLFHGTVDPKDDDGRRDTNCPECVHITQVAFEVRTLKSPLAFVFTPTFDSPGR